MVWHLKLAVVPLAILSPYDGPVADANSGGNANSRWWSLFRDQNCDGQNLANYPLLVVNRARQVVHVLLNANKLGPFPIEVQFDSELSYFASRDPPARPYPNSQPSSTTKLPVTGITFRRRANNEVMSRFHTVFQRAADNVNLYCRRL